MPSSLCPLPPISPPLLFSFSLCVRVLSSHERASSLPLSLSTSSSYLQASFGWMRLLLTWRRRRRWWWRRKRRRRRKKAETSREARGVLEKKNLDICRLSFFSFPYNILELSRYQCSSSLEGGGGRHEFINHSNKKAGKEPRPR